jgi:ATP sulfurylase
MHRRLQRQQVLRQLLSTSMQTIKQAMNNKQKNPPLEPFKRAQANSQTSNNKSRPMKSVCSPFFEDNKHSTTNLDASWVVEINRFNSSHPLWLILNQNEQQKKKKKCRKTKDVSLFAKRRNINTIEASHTCFLSSQ